MGQIREKNGPIESRTRIDGSKNFFITLYITGSF